MVKRNLVNIPVRNNESVFACSFVGNTIGSKENKNWLRSVVVGPSDSTDKEIKESLYVDFENVGKLEIMEIIIEN